MGTLKKKAGKRNGNGNGTKIAAEFAGLLEDLDALQLEAATKAAMISESLEGVHTNWTFPQAALQAALVLKAIKEVAEGAYKEFEKRAKGHIEAGGSFEPGKVAITFPETTRRNPKWKDEALALAELLEYNIDEYVEEVTDKYEPVTSVRVKLTESAG